MSGDRRSIIIDARLNSFAGAHGLARSVVRLAEHLVLPGDDDLAVRVLVNPGREQLFPLTRLAERAELVETDITLRAFHRCAELARLIRDLSAAVLYVPYPMFRPILCPCPVVVTIHDCTPESDASFAGGWHRQLGLRLVTGAVLRKAAAVTTPSRASLAQVRRYYPATNPVVIPNGVDPRPFTEADQGALAAAAARYRLPERYVLAVGAHRPHKNYEVLVRAMSLLPPAVSLVIAGYPDPSFRGQIPRLVADLGLRSRVRLIPSVDEALLPAVYRGASAFAFPSLAEGFGLPALEAMAARVPVVASAIGVFEEVCAGAATLVPPGDPAAWASALTSAIGNGPSVRARIAAGAAVAAASTWDRGGQALGELLTSVAGAGSHPRVTVS